MPGNSYRNVVKRTFDVVTASVLLFVLAPVIGVIGAMVRLTMGSPILFRQVRIGHRGREFVIYKFRTMRDLRGDDDTPLPDEERITRLGRLLRRTSLDELPELVNVVKGEMSLVGPRPLLPDYWELYTPDQRRRHDVLPGVTGPVQVLGRNSLTWEEKFALDVAYVDDHTVMGDLKLLWQTIWKVVSGHGVSAAGHATMPRFEGSATGPPNREGVS